ncbi:hypothetical protein JF50_21745 [Pseudoalteromonas luteoviolacea]|uniref:Uncharacterized protein n=1 Tax=Pseudoalteromonas luteoviolacea TaxID=43657 RepID=A0A0C1QH83_9GAMM|nr:hypothetical protein [Pseudoalteromonas luteoviolacea]KID54552.1 hypothetical protein JF50_21745 [Pseudoalteromonas luteoviolacea]
MKCDISHKNASLGVAFILLNVLSVDAANALNASCSAKLQVRHFQPQICYSEFNPNSCTDVCASATPSSMPQCFKEVALPCDVVAQMTATATGHQQEGSDTWFHVSDLLDYSTLIGQMNVFQASLFGELYHEYIAMPGDFGFTPASDELRKQNFRLDLLEKIDRESSALRYAAVYRRYSLGLELEKRLDDLLAQMMVDIDRFPYFSSTEKTTLKSELNDNVARQVRLWTLLKRYSLTRISDSRLSYLNRRLSTYATLLEQLPADLQSKMLDKSAVLNKYVDTSLAKCEQGVCFNEIVAPSTTPFYPSFDQQLSHYEHSLTALANEASALTYVYNGDYQTTPPDQLRQPDLAGFVSRKLAEYKAQRTDVNLERLATAINIAYLSQNLTGKETLTQLTQIADVTNNVGLATLETLDSQPILLCKEFQNLNPEMVQIQTESFELGIRAEAILYDMLENGYTDALIAEFESILARLSVLAMRSQVIANVRQFDEDRMVSVNWHLFEPSEMTGKKSLIEIEYFDYNGMFWTPRMPVGLLDLFPTLDGLATSTNSLLPNAIGVNSPSNNLQLKIRQSAFHGCSENNNQINMVVKITDELGVISRQVLTATLDQI